MKPFPECFLLCHLIESKYYLGETRHYGTPDQEGSLRQEDQNLPAKNPSK